MHKKERTMKGDFGLRIDFERGSSDPCRVFRSMAGLIDSFHRIDQHLASPFRNEIRPFFLLEDIESGSVTTWLKTALVEMDDEHLKNLELKKILGHFLVKAKYAMISFLEQEEKIDSREKVQKIQDKIETVSHETGMAQISVYSPPTIEELVTDVISISDSVQALNQNDITTMILPEGIATVSRSFKIDGDRLSEILSMKNISSSVEMILQVKKPDFLGNSKWLFRHHGHQIDATITDSEWLKEFHSQQIKVLPGDAIRAKVSQVVTYGANNEVIKEIFEIPEVLEVIRAAEPIQPKLP